MIDESSNLCGKFLIAMPDMMDPRFAGSVVFICAHSDDGAMGLIVNKPRPSIGFSTLLDQLEIPRSDEARDIRVYFGGPVENSRGFVLHSTDYKSDDGTMDVNRDIAMTATLDVLETLAKGEGPKASLLALGYSGWGPGQLEDEISQNGWLTCDADPKIVFGRANEHKWSAALKTMGVDPLMLSSAAGRA